MQALFFDKSGSSGVLIEKLENISKYLQTSEFLTENNPVQQSS